MSDLLKIVFPDDLQCLICERYKKLNKLGICDACQAQLEFDNKVRNFPYIDKIIATYQYNSIAQSLIERYKRGGQRYLSILFAKMIAEIVENADIVIDYITWVPASRAAKSERGFDNGKDIAVELAKLLELPVKALLKHKGLQRAQKNLSAKERFLNVESAFICEKEVSVGEHILIVDDVLTTGATMQSVAKAILEVEAQVNIYAVAVFDV